MTNIFSLFLKCTTSFCCILLKHTMTIAVTSDRVLSFAGMVLGVAFGAFLLLFVQCEGFVPAGPQRLLTPQYPTPASMDATEPTFGRTLISLKSDQDLKETQNAAGVGISVMGRSLAVTGLFLSSFWGGGLEQVMAAPMATSRQQSTQRQVCTLISALFVRKCLTEYSKLSYRTH